MKKISIFFTTILTLSLLAGCNTPEQNYVPPAPKEFSLTLNSFDLGSDEKDEIATVSIVGTDKTKFIKDEEVSITTSLKDEYVESRIFIGWYSDDTLLSSESTYKFSMPEKDYTLTAKYHNKRNVYLYSYDGDETKGTFVGAGSYAEGTKVNIKAVPNEGYAFGGWYDENYQFVSELNNEFEYELADKDLLLFGYFTIEANKNSKVQFGKYPQSIVTDKKILKELNNLAGNLPSETDDNGWTSYKYYMGASKPGKSSLVADNSKNYMWFSDVQIGLEMYRGVYFTSYRPIWTNGSSNEGSSLQDNRGYLINTTYWFKYEPISWSVLDDNGLLVADKVLDVQQFYYDSGKHDLNGERVFANNYEASDIRFWLNNEFYNSSFNEAEKNTIKQTLVKNDLSTTGDTVNEYLCNDTNDKVFLLSKADMGNAEYGFENDSKRIAKTTDYANCMGAYINVDSLNARYWTRSPNKDKSYSAYSVDMEGKLADWNVYGVAHGGVRPAITLVK